MYQWLGALKILNPLYADEPSLPSYDQFKTNLDSSIERILDNALSTQDNEAVERTEIARDDIAGIRATSQNNNASNVGDDKGLSLRYCYLTNANKTEFDKHMDTTHEFLCNAARTAGVDIEMEQKQYRETQSRRSQHPVNEFEDGQRAFLGGWPDVFLLGRGYASSPVRLADKEISHLLLQYTNAAASSVLLLFFLFDQKQRHSTIRNMSAKVKQNPRAFEKFTKTFMSADFQTQLQKSVAKPDSKDAKKVLAKLVPILSTGGKKTVFGALERRSAAGEILAMGRKYGPASNFLTVSVDDVNSPMVFRLAFRSTDNISFPAHGPDSLLRAMEFGENFSYISAGGCRHGPGDFLGTGEIIIPCNWSALTRKATENPVSVALHYNKIIYDLMTILVGIKPGTTSGNNNRSLKTEYRGWGSDSLGVIVGTPVAFTGVTETNARGGLHFHVGKSLCHGSI